MKESDEKIKSLIKIQENHPTSEIVNFSINTMISKLKQLKDEFLISTIEIEEEKHGALVREIITSGGVSADTLKKALEKAIQTGDDKHLRALIKYKKEGKTHQTERLTVNEIARSEALDNTQAFLEKFAVHMTDPKCGAAMLGRNELMKKFQNCALFEISSNEEGRYIVFSPQNSTPFAISLEMLSYLPVEMLETGQLESTCLDAMQNGQFPTTPMTYHPRKKINLLEDSYYEVNKKKFNIAPDYDAKLSLMQKHIINIYTGGSYEKMNGVLRGTETDPSKIKEFLCYSLICMKGLSLLPPSTVDPSTQKKIMFFRVEGPGFFKFVEPRWKEAFDKGGIYVPYSSFFSVAEGKPPQDFVKKFMLGANKWGHETSCLVIVRGGATKRVNFLSQFPPESEQLSGPTLVKIEGMKTITIHDGPDEAECVLIEVRVPESE